MSLQVEIRRVKETDIAALARLAATVFSETFGDSLAKKELEFELKTFRSVDYFKEAIKSDVILVAYHKTDLVGYIQVGDVDFSDFKVVSNSVQIRRLYVDKTFQGKGVAQSLLNAAMILDGVLRAKQIYLSVWEENKRALHFYKKNGFKIVGKTYVYNDKKKIGEDLVMKMVL